MLTITGVPLGTGHRARRKTTLAVQARCLGRERHVATAAVAEIILLMPDGSRYDRHTWTASSSVMAVF